MALSSASPRTSISRCKGDSGGPALDADGNAFAFALASRNTADCTVTAYLTFTNHLDWLKTATSKAAAQKDYDVPEWAALGPTPGDTSGDTSGCGGASDGNGGAENCSTGTVASNRLHAVGGGGCSFRPTTPTPWLPL